MLLSPFPLTLRERTLGQAVQCHDPDLARRAALELASTLGPDEAYAWADCNGTASILGHNLLAGASPQLAPFAAAHSAMNERISAYMQELDGVARHFASAKIPVVALKNSGITRGIYRCTGCSPMGDLDLLISPHDFRRSHSILLELGYTFNFRSELETLDLDHAEASGGSEYERILPNGETLWLELQWRPVAGRWIRPDQEPSAEELLERSSAVPQSDVRILEPHDNLLQVALHTAKHTYVRAPGYRLHTDIDRIVTFCEIDWDEILRRVRHSQVCTAVYFSLALARELLQTPIPTDVLAAIRPAAWKERQLRTWLHQAGLFHPDDAKFGRARFLALSALLYDSGFGLARAIFPDTAWMRKRYRCSLYAMPYYYVRRMSELVWKRSQT